MNGGTLRPSRFPQPSVAKIGANETLLPTETTPWRKRVLLLLMFTVVLLLAVLAIAVVDLVKDDEHHDDDDNDGANLVLHDSQRITLGESLVIPEPGDEDIILVVVENVDDHDVINITVTLDLTSEARRRSAVSIALLCPPLYVDNTVSALAPHTSTTCRGFYTLTADDIVNGNVLHTHSMATGTLQGTEMTTMAKPGMSQLGLNNLEMPHGAVFAIAGPTGPTSPLNVKVGPCSTTPPLTGFPCDETDQLSILVCNLASNSSLIGNFYLCIDITWEFLGSVNVMPDGNSTGPTGPTGPQGISLYSAMCAGGPPPTTVSGPTYTCNSSFALNMVLCNLGSTDGNAGKIYECECSPSCGWVEVGDINGPVPYAAEHCFNFGFVNTPNVWSDLCFVTLNRVGFYYCLSEGIMRQMGTVQSCSLTYGMSTVSMSPSWFSNSDRLLNLPPIPTNPVSPFSAQWTAPILTTGIFLVSTAPQTIYFTAGIGNQTAGCGHWGQQPNYAYTMNCLLIDPLFL
jgi:hypothetical protein